MNELTLIRSELLGKFMQVRCAVSTRKGTQNGSPFGMNMSYSVGDQTSAVDENRRRFFSALDVPADRVASPGQCHSSQIALVTDPGRIDATDALITETQDLWLAISVADCTPVFLADPGRSAVAAIHAGWRGSAESIVVKAVERMKAEFGTAPKDLLAFIGPSAGACCYEVGDEVAGRFRAAVVQIRNEKRYLDLKLENAEQLKDSGVSGSNIEISPLCTICNPELLHSYRRDGKRSGRMMGVIGMVKGGRS
jgi:hypothetical protein